jgi:hypothetical protein
MIDKDRSLEELLKLLEVLNSDKKETVLRIFKKDGSCLAYLIRFDQRTIRKFTLVPEESEKEEVG